MKTIIFNLFLFLTITNVLLAQDDPYQNANNPGMAKEKYALMSDNLVFAEQASSEKKAKEQYKKSAKSAQWLLKNEPKLSENMYIKIIKIYDELEERAKEETAEEAAYQDTLLMVYDMRFENGFYDSADYYRYKGYKFYPFKAKGADKAQTIEMFRFYQKALETNKGNTPRSHLTFLTALMCSAKKLGEIDGDELMAIYEDIDGAFAYNIENDTKGSSKWKKAKTKVDELALRCLDVDCDFVKGNLCPQMSQRPDDVNVAKKIVKYSIAAQCTSDPCYFTALETLSRLEPTCGLNKKIGEMYFDRGDTEKGIAAYQKAAEELCASEGDKAEAYYDLAKELSSKGRLTEARSYAFKAAEMGKTSAYSLIGTMYMNSFNTCGEANAEVKSNPVKTAAVYFAAYEMFQKAGDNGGMGRAAARFPTASQIFTQNMKEGDQVSIDHCWIGGSYTIRKR